MNIIQQLFSKDIVCVEGKIAAVSGELYHEEQLYIEKAREKRKKEFIAGRLFARTALRHLGIYHYPIKVRFDRTPIWPANIIGSISHTDEYCGVALSGKDKVFGLGLDIEHIEKVKKNVWERICTRRELSRISLLPIEDQQKIAALTFSAKECFYKCQYPVSKQWLNFHDLEIDIHRGMKEFTIIVNIDIKIFSNDRVCFKGRYLFYNDYVFTGMTFHTDEVS